MKEVWIFMGAVFAGFVGMRWWYKKKGKDVQ
jgi:hypothetical protein